MLISKDLCTGCGVCSLRCPQKCIRMLQDEEGFFYPYIDVKKCVRCNLCVKVCPINSSNALLPSGLAHYIAAATKDERILEQSSSGGIFSVLAKYIIDKGGYVCGCIFDESFKAVHICTDRWEDVLKMLGSKYVQSNAYACFSEIEERLKCNTLILFTGTPCQIAGLKMFLLNANYPNLITVDIICHGVPSPYLLEKYIDSVSEKYHGKLIKIDFRNKMRNGWGAEHHTYIELLNGKKTLKIFPFFATYFTLFFWGVAMRQSCYSCRFAVSSRCSDITLGDFWGAGESFKEYLRKGISIVGINSKSGAVLLDNIKPFLAFSIEQDFNTVSKGNIHLLRPVLRRNVRDFIYKLLKTRSYRYAARRVILSKECRKLLLITLYRRLFPSFLKKIVTFIRHHSK